MPAKNIRPEEKIMIKSLLRGFALAAALSAVAFAAAKNPVVGGAAMFESKNIIENAMNSKDHTTLVAAVKAAGLVGTLESKGPFTVFAPTNEAFAALPKGTVDTLLKPENKATLTKVLTCHVVAADAMAKTVAKMIKDDGGEHDIKTVGGCVIKARESMGKITLTDENGDIAHVTIADVKQSNGVIHVVDKVLLPKM
ncbi:fasciclin domain-containing protein [Rhizobium sp. TAL182]|nr:fasciclin domain-containing protein [Rhizobium sp. TAL182]